MTELLLKRLKTIVVQSFKTNKAKCLTQKTNSLTTAWKRWHFTLWEKYKYLTRHCTYMYVIDYYTTDDDAVTVLVLSKLKK